MYEQTMRLSESPQQIMPDHTENQQVAGIEEIEKVTQSKPAFSVVEKTQNKGKRRDMFPCDRGCPDDALIESVVMEKVQHDDQKHTLIVIVRHQGIRQIHGGRNRKKLNPGHAPQLFEEIQAQKPDQQCKEYILLAPERYACLQSIVKRKLRDKGKQKHPFTILPDRTGVEEAFHDQKTVDRKRQTADLAHESIKGCEILPQVRIG